MTAQKKAAAKKTKGASPGGAAKKASPAKKAIAKKRAPRAKKPKPDPVTEQDPLPGAVRGECTDGASIKMISWNVDGFRAPGRMEMMQTIATEESPDLIFLQETKLQEQHVAQFRGCLEGYDDFWSCCTVKRGTSCSYAGTAVFVKQNAVALRTTNVEATPVAAAAATPAAVAAKPKAKSKNKSIMSFFGKKKKEEEPVAPPAEGERPKVSFEIGEEGYFGRQEGRAITVECEHVIFLGLYVPNSGMKLEHLDERTEQWDPQLRKYIASLQERKPVVVTGDLNVAHRDVDIYNYFAPHLKKTPGCTMQERDSFSLFLEENKMRDAFRSQHGDVKGHYTYWSMRTQARAPNKGLRLDYFTCSENMFDQTEGEAVSVPRVHDCYHLDKLCSQPGKYCSDHCPIAIVVATPAA